MQRNPSLLFMVRLSRLNLKRTVHLFEQQDTHKLMGKGKRAERNRQVGAGQKRSVQAERSADYKRQNAVGAIGKHFFQVSGKTGRGKGFSPRAVQRDHVFPFAYLC